MYILLVYSDVEIVNKTQFFRCVLSKALIVVWAEFLCNQSLEDQTFLKMNVLLYEYGHILFIDNYIDRTTRHI